LKARPSGYRKPNGAIAEVTGRIAVRDTVEVKRFEEQGEL